MLAAFIFLEYVTGPPTRIETYTLPAVLLARRAMDQWLARLSTDKSALAHAVLAGGLLLAEPVGARSVGARGVTSGTLSAIAQALGYEGLGLAYGARAFLYAFASGLRTQGCAHWWLWFLAGFGLHLHKNMVNVIGERAEPSASLRACLTHCAASTLHTPGTLPAAHHAAGWGALGAMVVANGMLCVLPANQAKGSSKILRRFVPTALLQRALLSVSRYSLEVYVGHLVLFKLLAGRTMFEFEGVQSIMKGLAGSGA